MDDRPKRPAEEEGEDAAAATAGGRGKRSRGDGKRGDKRNAPPPTPEISVNDPDILAAFKDYATVLTARQDQRESIVVKSRAITQESKRTIFLLHRSTSEPLDKVLAEADEKLKAVRENFRQIALELQGQDANFFSRSFSPGSQEYVEAATYFEYLRSGKLATHAMLQADLVFPEVTFELSPMDYILGVADLTGELMRKCIGSIGSGLDASLNIANFMRELASGFNALSGNRDLTNKVRVLNESLKKVELACYNLRVRGAEVPANRLLEVMNDDEEQ